MTPSKPTKKQKDLFDKVNSYISEKNQTAKKTKFDEIKSLIEGTSLNFKDEKTEHTILHVAVIEEDLELLKVILDDSGINSIINLKTKEGDTAIDLAISKGSLKMFKALHEKDAAYSPKILLTKLKQKIAGQPANADQLQKIADFIKNNIPKRIKDENGEALALRAFPESLKQKAQEKEFSKQATVTERFFRVGKPLEQKKNSTKLYGEILTAIDMDWLVELDDYSSRAVIIAVTKLMQKFKMFPKVVFKIGNTVLSCSPSDKRDRQVGNLLVTIENLNVSPSYGNDIMGKLNPVLGAESLERELREIKLAKLLRLKSKIIQSFKPANFNQTGLIKIDGEAAYSSQNAGNNNNLPAIRNAIHILNFLNFMHSIGEICRRLYRDKDGNLFPYSFPQPAKTSDRFPVAAFHTRVLNLMQSGTIRLDEVYGSGGKPPYGLVGGKSSIFNIDEVTQKSAKFVNQHLLDDKKIEIDDVTAKQKGFSINELMSNYHKTKHASNYKLRHPNDYLQATPFWLRWELGRQFGGDSESDGSDYEDAKSDTEYLSEDEAPPQPKAKLKK